MPALPALFACLQEQPDGTLLVRYCGSRRVQLLMLVPQQGQQAEGQEACTVAACEWFDDLAAAELDPTVDVLEREAAKLMQQVCAGWLAGWQMGG